MSSSPSSKGNLKDTKVPKQNRNWWNSKSVSANHTGCRVPQNTPVENIWENMLLFLIFKVSMGEDKLCQAQGQPGFALLSQARLGFSILSFTITHMYRHICW